MMKSRILRLLLLCFVVFYQLSLLLVIYPKAWPAGLSTDLSNLSTDAQGYLPGVNGQINKIVPGPNNTIYAGGSFSAVGKLLPGVASFNANTAALDPNYRILNTDDEPFNAAFNNNILSDGSNGVIRLIRGTSNVIVVQVADDSGNLVSSWNTGITGTLNDSEFKNGKLYFCGNLSNVSGGAATLAELTIGTQSIVSLGSSGSA